MQASIQALSEALEAAGDPDRAAQSARYLHSDLRHLGVRVPQIRAITRDWARSEGDWDEARLILITNQLWPTRVYELRAAAVELLVRYRRALSPGALPSIESLLRDTDTWALVDPLAIDVVGSVARGDPEGTRSMLDRWSGDDDFWLRRAALLSQLRLVRLPHGDPKQFFEYADRTIGDREFFVAKAIGWTLRDMGRRRPDEVFQWLLPRARAAQSVTIREALRPMSRSRQDAIRDARSAGPAGSAPLR